MEKSDPKGTLYELLNSTNPAIRLGAAKELLRVQEAADKEKAMIDFLAIQFGKGPHDDPALD